MWEYTVLLNQGRLRPWFKTRLGLSSVYSSDPAVSSFFFVGDKWENVSENDSAQQNTLSKKKRERNVPNGFVINVPQQDQSMDETHLGVENGYRVWNVSVVNTGLPQATTWKKNWRAIENQNHDINIMIHWFLKESSCLILRRNGEWSELYAYSFVLLSRQYFACRIKSTVCTQTTRNALWTTLANSSWCGVSEMIRHVHFWVFSFFFLVCSTSINL